MTLPTLVVRADANTQIGTGHLFRTLALAHVWKSMGGQTYFVGTWEGPALEKRLRDAGHGLVHVPVPHPDPTDLRTTGTLVEQMREADGQVPWLVLDGYHFDEAYQESVRALGCRLLVIDDFAHRPLGPVDLVLNQNLGAEWLPYQGSPETVFLLGSRYVLLRHEFLGWRGWERKTPPVATRILITLGGADPDNVTLMVLSALEHMEFDTDLGVDAVVVAGPSNPHASVLRRAVARLNRKRGYRIRLLHNVSNMPELMAWADVAVAAGGSTSWELAFMGVPVVVLILADNQEGVARNLADSGAAITLGWHHNVSPERLGAALTQLCRDADLRQALSHKGRQLVDGYGARRVSQIMAALSGVEMGEPAISLRKAGWNDALFLWRLANDPTVRRYSFSPEPISLERHLEWYHTKLVAEGTRIWLLELYETPVAQVRYDRVGPDVAEVDYAVIPAMRGRGLGTRILTATWSQACRELGVQRIRGVVIAENQASAQVFRKAGFVLTETRTIAGRLCLVFERHCC